MFSPDNMLRAEKAVLLPLMLLANFAVFQYLVLLFHKRWREPYVLLLLFTATLGWVSLVPFAPVDSERLQSMNNVSEGSLALLLLVQTALVGTPKSLSGAAQVAKRICIPEDNATSSQERTKTVPANEALVRFAARCGQIIANLLILIEVALLILDVGLVFYQLPRDHEHRVELVNNTRENVTLAFTLLYRFGLLVMGQEHGWRRVLRDDWFELLFHIIFATHEYPFMLAEGVTETSWEYVQGLYMRLTVLPCIWMTIGGHQCHLQIPALHSPRRLSRLNAPANTKFAKTCASDGGAIKD
ncbi:uncharacterized protein KRP23_9757 [Phytophthora ramorum]|uniref:uncharacterized protein n=1 Tax=Phytophthora ramorum TaxID=164328 RepID=UPI00309A1C55|nr:hypothetical protein KRP23_9757 [Phytophthora ramorum]